ncbi:hypothetical protein [Undibacterium parvum]|uniref:Glycosyltransferase RgtA/B/C/D-like domain-containing protein n=2 Tax=Undibacterium TaxID=401469 RepID=A0A6M4A4V5_9BURK|nr:hypothetical protein [Undibacterium parvum]AZP11736.1 hypothetical protein EJN92_06845 [Undibacterium parvum]QJQ06175.1 hypothetical protein EJG51_010255 [Undibacterium piscinae]
MSLFSIRLFTAPIFLVVAAGSIVISYLAKDPALKDLFNSDAVFLPLLFQNLFDFGGNIRDWYLTPAPYFFPDYLVFLVSHYVGENIYSRIVIFAIIQTSIMFVFTYLISRQLEKKSALFTSTLVTILMTWLSLNAGEPFILMLFSAFHFGAFISSMIFILLLLLYPKCKTNSHRALILSIQSILTFLSSLSDTLFVVQTLIPVFFSVLLINIIFHEKQFRNYLPATIPLPFGILGLVLYPNLIEHNTRYSIVIGIEKIDVNFSTILSIFNQVIVKTPFFGVAFIFYLAFSVLCFMYLLKKRFLFNISKQLIQIIIFVFFSILSMLFVALLVTNQAQLPPRYYIATFIWPIIIGTIVCAYMLKNKFFYFYCSISIVISVYLCLNALSIARNNEVSDDFYPKDISCLDRAISEENLSNGIAQYWDAKYIQAFSKSGVTLAQYWDDLNEMRWITSKTFFKNNYDFAIVSKDAKLFKKSIEQINIVIGVPQKTITCGNRDLLIYGKNNFRTRKINIPGDSYKWLGCNLPTVSGNYTSKCEIENERNSKPGALSFGPYEKLPSGNYFFEIEYVSDQRKSDVVGDWDLAIALPEQAKVLQNGTLLGTDAKEGKVSGFFSIDSVFNMEKIEFRTFARTGQRIKIIYFVLKRLT